MRSSRTADELVARLKKRTSRTSRPPREEEEEIDPDTLERSCIDRWLSLGQVAYKFKTTTHRIAGAARALKLKEQTDVTWRKVRGVMHPRTSSAYSPSGIRQIRAYLEQRYGK